MAPQRREAQGFGKQPLPRLRPAVHEMIGRRLRLHYDEIQQQPLPSRFDALLDALDQSADANDTAAPAARRN